MTKKKSLTKNYIYNASYQVLALITPLITTPYLSRVLEADGIGVYSFTTSIVSYFTMFGVLGTLSYGNREIAYLQEETSAINNIKEGNNWKTGIWCVCHYSNVRGTLWRVY